MALAALDHVTIHTARLGELTDFYARVLGLRSGTRPGLKSNGAWLYCGDRPALHLIEVPAAPDDGVPPAHDGEVRTPKIEHFAFRAEGLSEFLADLREFNVAYRTNILADLEIRQVHIRDPEGHHIEIAFGPEEEAELEDFPGR